METDIQMTRDFSRCNPGATFICDSLHFQIISNVPLTDLEMPASYECNSNNEIIRHTAKHGLMDESFDFVYCPSCANPIKKDNNLKKFLALLFG